MLRTTPAYYLAALTGSAVFAATEPSNGPLTPENERGTFQFADTNLIIELVATEPDVASPVAIAWDADGQMFVAEMMDYPNAPTGGRINENGWWRDTAQRLLVERQDQKAIPALKKLARKGQLPETRVQAISTLAGLRLDNGSALDGDTLYAALNDKHEEVRVNALKLSEPLLSIAMPSQRVSVAVEKMIYDPSPRVRIQLALTLGEMKSQERSDVLLAQLAREGIKDKWQSLAIQSSVRNRNGTFLKTLAQQNPVWFNQPTPEQSKFLEQIAIQIGARNDDAELAASLPVLLGGKPGPKRFEIVAGLAEGIARAGRTFEDRMTRSPATPTPNSLPWIAQAQSTATNVGEPLPHRLAAIRLLKQVKPESARSILLALLQPGHPPEVQSAAAGTLLDSGERDLAAKIFAGWSQHSASVRQQMLSSALRSPAATAAVIDALISSEARPQTSA